jgi:hypothetical protein
MRRGGVLGRLLGPLAALDLDAGADAAARVGASDVPSALAVEAVVPNPGADRVRVVYALPEAGAARVEVFDVRGRRVAVLADGTRSAGTHEATLDASALGAGVYVVRVVAGGAQAERQLTIAR